MPLLSYTSADFPFVPFTKIFSADINQCYNDIKTLLNVTGLDHVNVQALGLTRYGSSSNLASGTANYAVYNDANGNLTEAATLPTPQGGLGFAPTINASTANQVLAVNSAGSALTLMTPVGTAGSLIYNHLCFS